MLCADFDENKYYPKYTRVGILCIACKEERESVEKLGRTMNELVYTFPFLPASSTPISLQQQFPQKLVHHKPCWDQDRLPSLKIKKR